MTYIIAGLNASVRRPPPTPDCEKCGEPALVSIYERRERPRHLCGGCYKEGVRSMSTKELRGLEKAHVRRTAKMVFIAPKG